jgi:hypothetical protein
MKTETLEEFLARGGVIVKCPTVKLKNEDKISIAGASKPTIMSLGEAEELYGEKKEKKTKAKQAPKIDIALLPESLRHKLLLKIETLNAEEQ